MLRKTAVTPELWRLLSAVSPTAEAAGFALAGGTNLALRFGHRLSVDIDFFAIQRFDKEALRKSIASQYADAVLMNETEQSMRYIIGGVKTEFLLHEYPLVQALEMMDEVSLYSIADVAAMKVNAVIGRGARKDFWDIAVLLQRYPLSQLFKHYIAKYGAADPSLLLRALAYFEDAEAEPDPITLTPATWPEIKNIIRQAIRDF